jgi:hypothetical protein
MHRSITAAAAATALSLLLAGESAALEKASARAIDREQEWARAGTTTIRYYNNCTGWVWVWSGWSAGETMGTDFDLPPCDFFFLNTSWALTFSGLPAGYGFTGTIQARDAGCGTVLATQPYLPPVTSGWNATAWGGVLVPGPFSVNVIWGAPSGFTNSTGFASDHPLAGPTGPAACGTCFPTTRSVNSKYYGVNGTYCPSGTTLSDGLCDIEFMMEVEIKYPCEPTGVGGRSWGGIKSLYR